MYYTICYGLNRICFKVMWMFKPQSLMLMVNGFLIKVDGLGWRPDPVMSFGGDGLWKVIVLDWIARVEPCDWIMMTV